MENLFGTIGRKDPRYLLASNYDANAIAVSVAKNEKPSVTRRPERRP